MKAGFIGAGRTGCSIGKFFAEAGVPIAGYFDSSKEAADSAAAFTGSQSFAGYESLAAESSLIFLTTPDGIIPKVWEALRQYPIADKIICHCSGALSSGVFEGIENTHACGCSLHPMLPFSDRFSSYEQLSHAFFTIEGQAHAVQAVSDLFTGLGCTVCRISGECKPKYHAAASILSNHVAAVFDTGYRLLEECGFSRNAAIQATEGLIRQNVENILRNDCIRALTGPIERGDAETVSKHLACLNEEDKKMYQTLGLKLVKIAEKKHPAGDYDGVRRLLGTDYQ